MDFIKGNEQVKIDPSGIDISGTNNILLKSDGKVGIGTNNPQYPLQVNGSHAIFSNTPELLLFKEYGPGRLGPTLDWGNITYTDWKIKAEESGLKITSGSSGVTTESITINNTGNVGIGTTAPTDKLDLHGNLHIEGDYICIRSDANNDGNTGKPAIYFSEDNYDAGEGTTHNDNGNMRIYIMVTEWVVMIILSLYNLELQQMNLMILYFIVKGTVIQVLGQVHQPKN